MCIQMFFKNQRILAILSMSAIIDHGKKEMSVSAYFQFDRTDPLWNEAPTMGLEELVATVDD